MIKIVMLVFILLLAVACASNRIVVERVSPPPVVLNPKNHKTIEVREIAGNGGESFRQNLIQYISTNTSLVVINSQSTADLINSRLLGERNRQNYRGADLIIFGSVGEEISTSNLSDGSKQYLVTTRPQLELMEAESGKVLLSKYFIGTSLSQMPGAVPALSSDVYTDAIISARNVAFEKFVSQFTPQKQWFEISLYEIKDNEQFKVLKNLINYSQYDEAYKICDELQVKYQGEERGKILFDLAVVESLRGQYVHSRQLIYESHKLYPAEETLQYLKRIKQFESEVTKVSML